MEIQKASPGHSAPYCLYLFVKHSTTHLDFHPRNCATALPGVRPVNLSNGLPAAFHAAGLVQTGAGRCRCAQGAWIRVRTLLPVEPYRSGLAQHCTTLQSVAAFKRMPVPCKGSSSRRRRGLLPLSNTSPMIGEMQRRCGPWAIPVVERSPSGFARPFLRPGKQSSVVLGSEGILSR